MSYFTNSSVPALAETVVAGRVVALTGSLLGHAPDSETPIVGVSFDGGDAGEYITVVNQGSGIPVDVSGSVSAGEPLCAAGDGSGMLTSAVSSPLSTGSHRICVGFAEADSVGGKVRANINMFVALERSAE